MPELDPQVRDAFAGRMLGAFTSTLETLSLSLGQGLGFLELLARGPMTSRQLARKAGCDERYCREWLEQQAVAGILLCDAARPRRFWLPAAHADVLLNPDGPAYLGFAPRMAAAIAARLPDLQRAYRSGAGVSWARYGRLMSEAQADQNRGFLQGAFVQGLLPSLPMHERLQAGPSRIADLACGQGWAAIALAQAYPRAHVDGLDLDAGAVRRGRGLVRERGLSSRVSLQARDAADPALRGRYDLVTIVEAVHDLAQPVAVLRAARQLLVPGGQVLVVDENVADEFRAPGGDLERVFYGFSTLACLPNGRADHPSAATGTVMRPALLERYAKKAGFRSVQTPAFKHDFFRFYVLG